MIKNIECVKKEWLNAYNLFNNALGIEEVDHCTYKLKACEAKYEYLIKEYKKLNYKAGINEKIINKILANN